MTVDPLVTTIIPTYNRGPLVCEAIESVLGQTYRHVEIVVVDDGSTDDTEARLRKFGGSVRVIVQNNAGPSAARNRGIEAARGTIVAFLDSDDLWQPTKLERQVRLLQSVGEAVPCCLCNASVERPDGRAATTFQYAGLHPPVREGVWENVTELLATQFLMFTQMVAIRRTVLERIGGFDERLWVLEDYDLALRLSLEGPWAYVSEPLAVYREKSPGSLAAQGHSDELRLLEHAIRVRQSFYERVLASAHHQHLRQPCLRGLKAFRRQLRAMELSRGHWAHSVLGRSVLNFDRYRRALYRRSPWYPRMRVGGSQDESRGVRSRFFENASRF
ncbi:MAG TPA: glycosyltransferase family A protein [Vicinamibacterales bacterium]|nr:glycosyltransferase family A protein [Vicinamibacterales bacterium]